MAMVSKIENHFKYLDGNKIKSKRTEKDETEIVHLLKKLKYGRMDTAVTIILPRHPLTLG